MFYYQVNLIDVIEGRGPSPLFVLMLVRRLPESSATAALAQGGWQYFGWDTERHLLASLFDAINLNTRASGNFKKPPKIAEYPRPKPKKGEPIPGPASSGKPKVSVKEIYARGGLQRK